MSSKLPFQVPSTMDAPSLDQRKETGLQQGFFPLSTQTNLAEIHQMLAVSPCSDKENMINNDIDRLDQEESMTEEPPQISNRRKALFEPLEPTNKAKRPSNNEALLPPPDFDPASYPKGWLIGKKRKLVNVDVVESMRRIAIQEMNRKDREIEGLNEQLEEDARCLEHLQLQLLKERSERSEVERQNTMLQEQISTLMNMLQESQEVDEDPPADP